MKVGVFDSGVGGLTVLKSLVSSQSFRQIVYFGDTARVPYGVKDGDTIIRYSLEAIRFLESFEIDLCVVACNTASAYALDALRQASKVEVMGVIEPGVLALRNRVCDRHAPILVLGTKATIRSQQYALKLEEAGYTRIHSVATGLFVPFVEEGIFEGPALHALFEHYFHDMNFDPQAIILGCTHFPMIASSLAAYFSHRPILIHSGEAIMEYIASLHKLKHYPKTEVLYFSSENTESLKQTAKQWLKE